MLSQQEKLAFCKVCKNRSFSSDVGIICGLTKRPPTFNETCVDYQEDVKQITRDFERKHSHKITQPSGKVTPVSAGTRFANYFIDGIIHTVFVLRRSIQWNFERPVRRSRSFPFAYNLSCWLLCVTRIYNREKQ